MRALDELEADACKEGQLSPAISLGRASAALLPALGVLLTALRRGETKQDRMLDVRLFRKSDVSPTFMCAHVHFKSLERARDGIDGAELQV